MHKESRNTLLPAMVFLAILGTVVLAYYPGLSGPFVFDDIPNIVDNPKLALAQLNFASLWDTAFSGHSSIFRRPLATLSFAFNSLASGSLDNAFPFKVTNLAIHLVNTFLVWRFIALLLELFQGQSPLRLPTKQDSWVPLLVAAIWALHPLHLTSVLFVVQRMTSLSTMFVLTGLIVFLHGRNRVQTMQPYGFLIMTAGWFIGLVLGAACKENALLFPVLVLILELYFFARPLGNSNTKIKLLSFYVLLAFVPLLFAIGAILVYPDFIFDAYKVRDFTPWQRLLTESRVLWFYFGLLLVPDIRKFSLYHDDIGISTNIFTPWSTLPAALGIVTCAVFAVLYARKYPVLGFSILWYLLGHAMESSIIGLEIAHEHRNYLPDIGLLFGLVYAISRAFQKSRMAHALLTLLIPIGLLLGLVTNLQARTWSNEASLIQAMVRNHPGSARSHAIMGEYLAHRAGLRLSSVEHYKIASALAPHETGYLIMRVIIACEYRPELMPEPPFSGCSDNSNTRRILNQNKLLSESTDGSANNAGAMSTLDPMVIDKITTQLSSQSLRPSSTTALQALSNCITAPPHSCRNLYQVSLKWYRSALQNPYLSPSYRTNITIHLFDVSMWRGDYGQAMDTVNQELKAEPANATFKLMKANIYIKLNRLRDAEQVLDSLANSHQLHSEDLQEHIHTLKSMISHQRSLKDVTQPSASGSRGEKPPRRISD